jgi:hypothetical protein
MSLSKSIILSIAFCLMLFSNSLKAQTFGFGCLGFVGGYGGYSYQVYKPEGLNNYIVSFNNDIKDSVTSKMGNFGKLQGYRVGLNFFRADIKGFILTAKGFYQYLSEKKTASTNSDLGESNITYQFEMRNWGVGIDLGTVITGGLSWKVIDAALLYNSATFTNTLNTPGPATTILKYNNENPSLGYTVGTGFILSIVKRYISIEGVAGYSAFRIDKMKTSDGTELTVSENSSQPMKNFITTGGFNAVIQLNVGFPL